MGRREDGVAQIRESIERQDALGAKSERPYCLTLLAESLLATGAATDALLLCDQALELAARNQCLDFQPETHRVRAETIFALEGIERREEVEAEFLTALELARRDECRLLEDRTAMSYSRFLERTGGSKSSTLLPTAATTRGTIVPPGSTACSADE
jgi:hypothetical protein